MWSCSATPKILIYSFEPNLIRTCKRSLKPAKQTSGGTPNINTPTPKPGSVYQIIINMMRSNENSSKDKGEEEIEDKKIK